MFTAGVVCTVLAGIYVLFLVLRELGLMAGSYALKFTDNPTMRREMGEQREKLEQQQARLAEISTTPHKVMLVVFMLAAIICFYFQ